MDRGAQWATVHGVAKSRTRLKRLSTGQHACTAGQRFPVPLQLTLQAVLTCLWVTWGLIKMQIVIWEG